MSNTPAQPTRRIVGAIKVPGYGGMYTYQPIFETVQQDEPQALTPEPDLIKQTICLWRLSADDGR